MNPNDYLGKQYPLPPCWALVADVYLKERKLPVVAFRAASRSIRAIADAFRVATHHGAGGFTQIAKPVELCVVLLGKTERSLHHCGVWHKGRLLHALESGVYCEEMSVIGDRYRRVEYWAMR